MWTMGTKEAASSPRVMLVSASIGAGHDRAAAELARRLRAAGCQTVPVDLLDLDRERGDRLRRTYSWLLQYTPWIYDLAMRFWARWPTPLEHFVAARARPVERDLQRMVDEQRPDLVISVYNLASQCLGRLRAAGRIAVPVITYVTDAGAHPYWVHPGVDRYLTVLGHTAERLSRYGAGEVAAAGPLVRPEFGAPPDPGTARRRLGLPSGPLALLTAGSWSCGRVLDTLDLLLARARVTPVVLCAEDAALRDQVARRDGAIALGWVADMPGLLAACDVVVDNAGGLTFWEALASQRPVILFDVLPGHGRLNAEALDRCGAARWVRRRRALAGIVDAWATDRAAASEQVAHASSLLTSQAARMVLDSVQETA